MSAATLSPAAAAYLAELERELADIPHEERADLLEEVEASLVEAGDDPVADLGTPARFAAELRASAGLPPRPAQPAPHQEPLWTRLTRDPRTQAALGTARELAPIWWLLRGVLVVALLSVGVGSHYREIVPVLTGEPAVDVFLLALIPVASVAIGLAGRRHRFPLRPLGIAINLALAACLVLVPGLIDELNGRTDTVFVEPNPAAPAGFANSGVPVRNVYAYDRQGRLLHDVRLYDQGGQAIEVGRGAPPDPNRRLVFARGGRQLFNAFPIRYYEPGTHRVAHPNAAPGRLNPRPLR